MKSDDRAISGRAVRLDRQMEIGHQLVDRPMGGDEVGRHIAGMRGRVADPVETPDAGKLFDQARQPAFRACRRHAMIGVHVLAEEGDFPRAGIDQRPHFGHHVGHRPGIFGAAGIGNDAERAEPVAALLDGHEGGRPLRTRSRHMVENRYR